MINMIVDTVKEIWNGMSLHERIAMGVTFVIAFIVGMLIG